MRNLLKGLLWLSVRSRVWLTESGSCKYGAGGLQSELRGRMGQSGCLQRVSSGIRSNKKGATNQPRLFPSYFCFKPAYFLLQFYHYSRGYSSTVTF